MGFDVTLELFEGGTTETARKVAAAPERVLEPSPPNVLALGAKPSTGHPLQAVHQGGDRVLGVEGDQQVNVVCLAVELQKSGFKVGTHGLEHLLKKAQGRIVQTSLAVFGDEHQMCFQVENAMPALTYIQLTPLTPNLV